MNAIERNFRGNEMPARLAVAALCAFLAGCAGAPVAPEVRPTARGSEPAAPVVVYVVRHAEKDLAAADPKDPKLSEQGQRRAAALAQQIDAEALVAVYATPYARTLATAAPSAEAAGRRITEYPADGATRLAADIRALERGKVLVVGHSNTVPEILKALGVVEPVELGDGDYGDLFVVTLAADGNATMERRRFGE